MAVTDALAATVFALLAAVGFAGSQVTLRRGLVETSVSAGLLVSLPASLIVLVVVVLADRPASLQPEGLALFALAGLAAPAVARWAAATGVERLGPSIAVPIMQGGRPLLAVTAALVLLSEPLGLQRGMGLLLIVVGGASLTRYQDRDPDRSLRRQLLRPGAPFPLLAGAAYATSDVLMKQGLGLLPHPAVGAATAIASALVFWGAVSVSVPRVRSGLVFGRDAGWQVLSGVLSGLALLCIASALRRGDVTFVSPIVASQPLAVFLLSRWLLRDLEHLRPATVAAGVAIVAGTVTIAW